MFDTLRKCGRKPFFVLLEKKEIIARINTYIYLIDNLLQVMFEINVLVQITRDFITRALWRRE